MSLTHTNGAPGATARTRSQTRASWQWKRGSGTRPASPAEGTVHRGIDAGRSASVATLGEHCAGIARALRLSRRLVSRRFSVATNRETLEVNSRSSLQREGGTLVRVRVVSVVLWSSAWRAAARSRRFFGMFTIDSTRPRPWAPSWRSTPPASSSRRRSTTARSRSQTRASPRRKRGSGTKPASPAECSVHCGIDAERSASVATGSGPCAGLAGSSRCRFSVATNRETWR